jgi:tetratricopeptide (TPR) repeat protein
VLAGLGSMLGLMSSRALHAQSAASPLRFARGMAYLELEDLDLAIADLGKAIAYEPKQPLPRAKRGEAYARKGNLKRAVEDHSASLDIRPDPDTYRLRADANMRLGEYDAAIDDYGLAITYGRGKAEDHVGRARGYLAKKDPDRAIEHLDKAIEIEPNDYDANGTRAEAHELKENRE